MDNENNNEYELFREVWKRVTESPDDSEPITLPQKKTEPEPAAAVAVKPELPRYLEELMNDEASDESAYRVLANNMNSRQAAAALRSLSADEAMHLRRLQALYYLLTGDTYTPMHEYPRCRQRATLSALRDRYWAESEGSRAYAEAAKTYSDTAARPVFASFSQDEARHARTIESLIERLFS